MAARIRRTVLTEEWKARIKAGGIMSKLMDHVDGKTELSPTQVKAADILLKKIVPDLARQELTGKDGDKLIPDKIEFVLVRPETVPLIEDAASDT